MKHYSLNKIIISLLVVVLVIFSYLYTNNIINMDSLNTSSKGNRQMMTILIEVDKKKLLLIDREKEKVIDTYIIASVKSTSPTPLGSFQINEKAYWGEGFGSRWLGLNVPWGKYGIHGTNQPGSIGGNVSAGCIRMRNSDIEDLYDKVSVNTQVIILNGEFGPFGQGFRTLKPGDRGSDVLEIQKRMLREGFYNASLDGIYGEVMKKALFEFLESQNIPLTDKITESIYEELGIILMD